MQRSNQLRFGLGVVAIEIGKILAPYIEIISKKMKGKGIESGKDYMDWWENGTLGKKQVRSWQGIKWKMEENKTDKTHKTGLSTTSL